MNDKIVDALKKILPEEQVKDISAAITEHLEEVKAQLEAEFTEKLEAAYADLTEELKKNEDIGYKGYEEAVGIIQDLRNRLEMFRVESKKERDEGFEEAYQLLMAEKAKNESLELDLYNNHQKQMEEQREFFIEKLDQFLKCKGPSIYEQARRDLMNDPRMVEHKVALDRIVETVSDYISDDDYALANSSKLEAQNKSVEELKGKLRILEARNVRLDMENNKLNEALRTNADLITESKKNEKKERVEKGKNVQGRGRTVTEDAEIVKEHVSKPSDNKDTSLVESFGGEDLMHQMQVLSGVKKES